MDEGTRRPTLDEERCALAVRSRDARFDGQFFTAVRTTRIYCRPSCPARTPRRENMTFYPTAAAAQRAGYRACQRCRPDASPGSPAWDVRADVVGRAVRLVADGVVDREGVPGLARRLGYSERQVERHLLAELGAGPLQLARAARARTARTLAERTDLPLADVAFAAGFSSVRTFNATVREVYALTPGELRRRARGGRPAAPGTTLTLRLPFRPPLHPGNLFGHLAATAVPGVEEWRDGAYRAAFALPHGPAVVALRPPEGPSQAGQRGGPAAQGGPGGQSHVLATLRLADLRDLTAAISRCRRALDLDADPQAVDAALGADPVLAPLVAAVPGRRVPRTLDPAAFVVRAVLGQQVSTAAARTHAGRLVAALGTPVDDPDGGLTHVFPDPATIAAAADDGRLDAALAMPARRRATVAAVARALASGDLDVDAGADRDRARAVLGALPGIGPWTVETVAMRALGDPDAFTATDLGVRGAAAALGLAASPGALARRAAGWSPWRAYAVQHLWATADHPVNQLPAEQTRAPRRPGRRPSRDAPQDAPEGAPQDVPQDLHDSTPQEDR